jgi:hypothetical protein
MDDRMGIPLIVCTVFVIQLALFLPWGSADIGKHPTLTLHIKKNGVVITGEALVCYDTLIPGGRPDQASKDYRYIKDRIETRTYIACHYCFQGKCERGFYEVPSRIAILYPAHGLYNDDEASEQEIVPQLYESGVVQVRKPYVFDYIYEAVLNSGGVLSLVNKTSLVTAYGLRLFGRAFILTLVMEAVGAFVYILSKKLSPKVLLSVLLGNSISVPCIWFILPLIIDGIFPYLIVSESFAVCFEAFIIYKLNKACFNFASALPLSVILNALSFIIGGVSMFVLDGWFI